MQAPTVYAQDTQTVDNQEMSQVENNKSTEQTEEVQKDKAEDESKHQEENVHIENYAPKITVIGDEVVYVTLGSSYNELGATAFDAEDGDITSSLVVSGTVDINTIGRYYITYNVKDSKGLAAMEMVRKVKVIEDTTTTPPTHPVTIVATNIVCDSETDLPNYGNFGPDITSTTAIDYVHNHQNCRLSPNWMFQWSFGNEHGKLLAPELPGDFIGEASVSSEYSSWNTFGPTDSNGVTTTTISNLNGANFIWVREVLKEGYLPFSYPHVDNEYSAETYCHTDVLHYDNYDSITDPILGNTYYCVTWNVLKKVNTNHAPVITLVGNNPETIIVGSTYTDAGATALDIEDGDITSKIVASSTVNTNITGSYTVTYDVVDSSGLAATRVTRVVNVVPSVCLAPQISSALVATTTINIPFTFNLTSSSTHPALFDVSTTSLPSGLSFSTTTNSISGTPTVFGTFSIPLQLTSTCGSDQDTFILNILNTPASGANLSVSKTSNVTSVNAGGDVVYTITASNTGPEDATSVSISDFLPVQLDFVSATSTVGEYSTTTSMWTIGTLQNGSSTTLTLTTKVKIGTEGQKISNTAIATSTVADPDISNNTSANEVNINPAASTGGGGGGGGGNGGGGGGSNGPIVGSYGGGGGSVAPVVVVNPTTPVNACDYLLEYIQVGQNNNPVEVKKLQVFLRDFEGFTNLQVTGVYNEETINAVDIFQNKYKDDVLTPWGHTAPTSYVYILTKKKVNEIYCQKAFPVNSAQQKEIDDHRNMLDGIGGDNSGAEVGSNTGSSSNTSGPVGSNTTTTIKDTATNLANVGLTTLAGFSSSTKDAATGFVANVISSGKKIGNLASAIFAWPYDFIKNFNKNMCDVDDGGVLNWLNLVLLLIIVIISYLWYREYRNNKTLEEINKEIDLNK
jgi:uncharacterized repeat protein (TIGR01451 family)